MSVDFDIAAEVALDIRYLQEARERVVGCALKYWER